MTAILICPSRYKLVPRRALATAWPDLRAIAAQLHLVMRACAQDLIQGQATTQSLAKAQEALIGYGFEKIDYFAYCDGKSLLPLDHFVLNGRLLVAAWLSGVRLIDNIAV